MRPTDTEWQSRDSFRGVSKYYPAKGVDPQPVFEQKRQGTNG